MSCPLQVGTEGVTLEIRQLGLVRKPTDRNVASSLIIEPVAERAGMVSANKGVSLREALRRVGVIGNADRNRAARVAAQILDFKPSREVLAKIDLARILAKLGYSHWRDGFNDSIRLGDLRGELNISLD